MPALGISQDTGRIIAWLKNEGDVIKQGDAILEIETDKTTVEIEAAAGGILSNVTAHADEDVPVGTVIAFILAPGETKPAQAVKAAVPTIMQSAGMNPVPEKYATPVAARVAQAHGIDVQQIPSREKNIRKSDVEAYINRKPARVLASPKARRLADELGLDITQIQGSGVDHAVLADDVMQAVSVREITLPTPPLPQAQTQTGQMWRRMAERLSDSWRTIPHFFLKREILAARSKSHLQICSSSSLPPL
jgi:pyruvate dehydrogenase E2 component (dihydrolipoamide acetyltransferase)